jgi:amino acid transporter
MIGFAGGIVVIMIVGLCYAELASLFPVAGGEVAYVYEIFGLKPSFIIGWFLALAYIAVTSFEAISVGWIVGIIFPGTKGKALYMIGGDTVYLGSLVLGIMGMICLTWLNYRGLKSAAVFQEVLTYGLLILSVIFIGAGLIWGTTDNLVPLFSKAGPGAVIAGILAIFMTAPNWLAGFNTIPQTMEEKSPGTPLKRVAGMILLSIFLAGCFYLLVILSASMVTPWRSLLSLELPAAGAFEAAFRSPLLAKVVLLAGLCGMLTTWNTVFICSSRIVFALGRAHIIPPVFQKIHPINGSPFLAVLFIGIIGTMGAFLGRRAILPIVNVVSSCFALAFFFTCLGVIRLRRQRPEYPRQFRVPGGMITAFIGIISCLIMLFLSLYQPYRMAEGGFPIEWGIILFWFVLGIGFWILARKVRSGVSEEERRRLILSGLDVPAIDKKETSQWQQADP